MSEELQSEPVAFEKLNDSFDEASDSKPSKKRKREEDDDGEDDEQEEGEITEELDSDESSNEKIIQIEDDSKICMDEEMNEWTMKFLSPEALKKFLKFLHILVKEGDVEFVIQVSAPFTGIFVETHDDVGTTIISGRLKCHAKIKGSNKASFSIPIKPFLSIVEQSSAESNIYIYKRPDNTGISGIHIFIEDKENNPSFRQSSKILLNQSKEGKKKTRKLKDMDILYNMSIDTKLFKSICKFGKDFNVESIRFQLISPCGKRKKQKGSNGQAVETIISRILLSSATINNCFTYINQVRTEKVQDKMEKIIEVSAQESVADNIFDKGSLKFDAEFHSKYIYQIINQNKDTDTYILFTKMRVIVIHIPFANITAEASESFIRFIIPPLVSTEN